MTQQSSFKCQFNQCLLDISLPVPLTHFKMPVRHTIRIPLTLYMTPVKRAFLSLIPFTTPIRHLLLHFSSLTPPVGHTLFRFDFLYAFRQTLIFLSFHKLCWHMPLILSELPLSTFCLSLASFIAFVKNLFLELFSRLPFNVRFFTSIKHTSLAVNYLLLFNFYPFPLNLLSQFLLNICCLTSFNTLVEPILFPFDFFHGSRCTFTSSMS